MATTKISFDLNSDDKTARDRIKAFLSKSQGKVTQATVIRYALRIAAKGLPK